MAIEYDIDALEAAAKKASKGRWHYRKKGSMPGFVQADVPDANMPYGLEVLGDDYCGFGDDEQRERDCQFVAAANPNVVLDLIRRLREAGLA